MMAKQIKISNLLLKSILLAVLLALFCPTYLPAQIDVSDIIAMSEMKNIQSIEEPLERTTTQVEARIPTSKTIQGYRNQSRFQYELNQKTEVKEEPSWASQIVLWIFSKLFWLFAFPPTRWILIIVIALLLIRAIAKYTQVDFLPMLKKKKLREGNGDDYTNLDDDIDHDFDNLLNSAIGKQDYRLAVRLLFLKNLKVLSTKGLISWDKNKTNTNYLYEIKEAQLRNSFAQSSRIFDYIWYGEFDIDEVAFKTIHQQYNEFYRNVVAHAIQ